MLKLSVKTHVLSSCFIAIPSNTGRMNGMTMLLFLLVNVVQEAAGSVHLSLGTQLEAVTHILDFSTTSKV